MEYVCTVIKQNLSNVSKTDLINAIKNALLVIQEYKHISTQKYNTELMFSYLHESLDSLQGIKEIQSLTMTPP